MIEGVALPGLLALIMFGVGLDLGPRAFLLRALPTRSMVVGLLGVALILPAGGFVIAAMADVAPPLQTGLMLLAMSPVGLLASPLTGRARGNVALALALTMAVSILYIALAPLAIGGAFSVPAGPAGATIRVPADLLFGKIVLVTVLPAILGGVVSARLPAVGPRLSRVIARTTGPALAAVLGWIVFDNRGVLVDAPTRMLAAVLAIDLFAIVVAVSLGRLGRLDQRDRTALLFAHLMRQEGTGIFIAVSILALPAAAVPLIANTVFGLGFCGVAWLIRAIRVATPHGELARHRRSTHPA